MRCELKNFIHIIHIIKNVNINGGAIIPKIGRQAIAALMVFFE